jgi:hypothetical protein
MLSLYHQKEIFSLCLVIHNKDKKSFHSIWIIFFSNNDEKFDNMWKYLVFCIT